MKLRPAYVCEKCGSYALGEENASAVQEHERKPITGIVKRLDGLIVQIGRDGYSAFRKLPVSSPEHKALYLWENYSTKTLEVETSGLPPKLEEAMESLNRSLNPREGFTAEFLFNHTLSRYRTLPPQEFRAVAKKLKSKYPRVYAQTTFHRILKSQR